MCSYFVVIVSDGWDVVDVLSSVRWGGDPALGPALRFGGISSNLPIIMTLVCGAIGLYGRTLQYGTVHVMTINLHRGLPNNVICKLRVRSTKVCDTTALRGQGQGSLFQVMGFCVG